MDPLIAPPKGSKFHKFLSQSYPNATSSSQSPPVDVVVSTSVVGLIDPTTLVAKAMCKNKSCVKSRQFQLMWLPAFPWAKPIIINNEVTKIMCNVYSKI